MRDHVKMNYICWLLGIFIGLTSCQVIASENLAKDFLDIDVYTGPTGVTGQFTEQKNPNSFGFAANIFFGSRKVIRHPSFISVGTFGFSAISQDAQYPFPEQQPVDFSIRYLNLALPIYDNDDLSLYVGIGYSIITMINAKENKYVQNYGSELYELQARYDFTENWNFNYRTRWLQINQYKNGDFSFIEMWTHFVGLGYMIF